jgi:ADP-ribose pyrophosphatase
VSAPFKILYTGKFIRVLQQGKWEFVERPKTSGIVAILAITDAREIVLVEQERIPVQSRVIEIPAGLAGDVVGAENEELAEAARRELLEETGYEAGQMEFLTKGPPSAGLSTEVVTFFRARGLKKVAVGGGDESEDIKVHLVPLAEIGDLARGAGAGRMPR